MGVGLLGRFKQETKGIGESVKSSLSGFGFAGSIGGALLTKASVDAASDLAESQSKVNVVFKEGAQDVEDWSRSAATGLGISQQAALEAAGTFGNFLISMGLIPSKAQEMSLSLVGLASDLASFNNTNPEEALLAIRAGLAGEIEPLRRYGVALSAARIEQEAQAAGLNKSTATMSAAEKATFAYQIILKDTALAQGDFERTSGGLANQQRILAARLKDAEASLGKALVPLLIKGAQAATVFGKGLSAANKATDGWLGTLAGGAAVGAAVFVAVNKIASVARGLVGIFAAQTVATTTLTAAETANVVVTEANVVAQGQLAVASGTAAVAMETETVAATGLGTVLKGTLAPALAALGIGFIAGKKAGDEINKLLTGAVPKVDELTAALLRLNAGENDAFDFSKFADDLKGQIDIGDPAGPVESVKEFFGVFTKNAHQAKADIGPLNEALKNVLQTEGVDAATLAYGNLVNGLLDLGVPIGTIGADFVPFNAALDLARAKEEGTSTATKNLTADVTALSEAFAHETATFGIADSLDAVKEATDQLAELRLEAAGKGKASIDAAKAERRAQESLTDALDSQGDATRSLAEAKAKLADFDSPTDTRIRDLELQQIQSRVVTTPEEARQKEIDLLKFSEDTADRRADLQRSVAAAEEGVIDAAHRVEDAQVAVSDASNARRQVQVDAAEAIEGAERRAQEAIIAAGEAILKAKDDQLIGNEALGLYLGLLDEMAGKLGPGSPLTKNLDDYLAKLVLADAIKGTITTPAGPVGPDNGLGVGFTFDTPAPSTAPFTQDKPTIDYHPSTTVVAPDRPSRQTIDELNRKHAIRLSGSGVRG